MFATYRFHVRQLMKIRFLLNLDETMESSLVMKIKSFVQILEYIHLIIEYMKLEFICLF
jgi:hypothetical protein